MRNSSSFSPKYLHQRLRSERKLEREHKKKRKKMGEPNHNFFSPPPLSLFICSRPNFLNEPARKRLLLRLLLSEAFTPIIKVSYPYVCILPTGRSFLSSRSKARLLTATQGLPSFTLSSFPTWGLPGGLFPIILPSVTNGTRSPCRGVWPSETLCLLLITDMLTLSSPTRLNRRILVYIFVSLA